MRTLDFPSEGPPISGLKERHPKCAAYDAMGDQNNQADKQLIEANS
jgi:hypothetical protein